MVAVFPRFEAVSIPRIFSISPAKAEESRLGIKQVLGDRTCHIPNLAAGAGLSPFTVNAETLQIGPQLKTTVILDVDGVMTPPDPSNGFALRKIGFATDEFIVCSGRLNTTKLNQHRRRESNPRAFSKFPFINEHSATRLANIVARANPDCDVSTRWLGFGKQLPQGRADFVRNVLERLQSGRVVIFGSDNVDDRMVGQVISEAQRNGQEQSLANLYYYCTDRTLVGTLFDKPRQEVRKAINAFTRRK